MAFRLQICLQMRSRIFIVILICLGLKPFFALGKVGDDVEKFNTLNICESILDRYIDLNSQVINEEILKSSIRELLIESNEIQTKRGSSLTFSELAERYLNHEYANVEELFRAIKIAAKAHFIQGPKVSRRDQNAYFKIVEPAKNGRTLHFADEHPDSIFESVWTLYLPRTSLTVWSLLNRSDRLTLLELLEHEFHKGEYDHQINKSCSTLEQMTYQAIAGSGHRSGFSPMKFLGAAQTRAYTGVCRHSNQAMAGLLYELGIFPNDIKIITGTSADLNRHMFLSIRVSPDSSWLEYDATGAGLNFEFDLSDDAMGHWAQFSLSDREERSFSPSSLRKKYYRDQKFHNEFFRPR